MDDVRPWQAPSTSAGSDEEDALLRDALAFIGDLDFDLDDNDDGLASPPDDDDGPAPGPGRSLTGFVAPMLPLGDARSASPLPASAIEPQAAAVSTAIVQQPKPRTAKPRAVNHARTRRRQELAYLRGLVGDLEARLTKLRSSHDDSGAGAGEESTELVDAWAQVATRQHDQRRKSELENAQLKRLLQEQIQVGKSLERILRRKRPTLEALESESAAEKRRRRTNSRAWNHGQVFDELMAECAALYAETDSVVARYGRTAPGKPRRNIQLVHDAELGLTLQTVDFQILPFSYEDTASVVWSTFSEASTVHRLHSYHDVDLTDNTLKLQFRVVTEFGHARGEFAITMVTRRYVEAQRTVIVSSAIIDPSEISQMNMAGVRMRQTGWHIIEPTPASVSFPSGATKVLVHNRAVPEVDDDLPDQTCKVGTLTNFSISTIGIEMESRSQNVENRLLQLSLRGGSSSSRADRSAAWTR